MPRNSVIAACVCALTSPGISTWSGNVTCVACAVIAIGVGCAQNGDDAAAVDDQRVVGQHARRLDGHDPARIDAQVNGRGVFIGRV